MLFLTLDWGLGLLLLFLIIPLALPCGFVQYLISSKVKSSWSPSLLWGSGFCGSCPKNRF